MKSRCVKGWPDTCYILKEKLAYRTEGIVIEAVPEHIQAVPVFQHGGSAHDHRMQPTGRSGLLQDAECFFCHAVVTEGGQQIHGRQEAGVQVVIRCLQFLFQLINYERFLIFTDHIQRQGPDIGCLMSLLNLAVRSNQIFVIGRLDLSRQAAVVCRVFRFAKDLGHVSHIIAAAFGVGGGNFRLAILRHVPHKVHRSAALHEQLDNLRCRRQGFVPLAIVEPGIVNVITVTVAVVIPIRIPGVHFLHAGKGEFQPPFGGVIVICNDLLVSVHKVKLIGQPHGAVAPAHAVLADVSVSRGACQCHLRGFFLHPLQLLRVMDRRSGREGNAHLTAGILFEALIRQPFFEELFHIHEVSSGIHIDLGITGPGIFLSGGAIHRNIQKVTLLAPTGIFHQFVDERIGTAKIAGFLHVGIDRNGGKFAAVHALDQSIAESKPGEVGGVFLPLCTLADIGHFLEFCHTAVAVGGGEFTLFVQTLTVLDMHDLSRLSVMQNHVDKACNVLTKIRHQIACTVPE